jgi:hypothetical protein
MEITFPELNLDNTVRYAAKWDESEQILIVDLKKPISGQVDDEKEISSEVSTVAN